MDDLYPSIWFDIFVILGVCKMFSSSSTVSIHSFKSYLKGNVNDNRLDIVSENVGNICN